MSAKGPQDGYKKYIDDLTEAFNMLKSAKPFNFGPFNTRARREELKAYDNLTKEIGMLMSTPYSSVLARLVESTLPHSRLNIGGLNSIAQRLGVFRREHASMTPDVISRLPPSPEASPKVAVPQQKAVLPGYQHDQEMHKAEKQQKTQELEQTGEEQKPLKSPRG
jgi:hypothetical protein